MANLSLFSGGRGHNYTGMLTRSIVFSAGLLIFLATTALSLAAITIPSWISYDSYGDHGRHIKYSYGLSKQCSNTGAPPSLATVSIGTNLQCIDFPRYQDCHAEDRYFCSMWRSMGFLMSLSVVFEGMTIAAFIILISGGKQKREQGWPVMASLAGVAAIVQAVAMTLMTYLYENDDRFFHGWFLDKSWIMCTISWSFQAIVALAITLAALCLPSEGGYELIPDRYYDDDA